MSVCETVVTIHLGLLDVYPSTCLRQMTGLVICAVSAHPSSWSSSAVSGTSSGRSRPFRDGHHISRSDVRHTTLMGGLMN
jgi:hypothetical protein